MSNATPHPRPRFVTPSRHLTFRHTVPVAHPPLATKGMPNAWFFLWELLFAGKKNESNETNKTSVVFDQKPIKFRVPGAYLVWLIPPHPLGNGARGVVFENVRLQTCSPLPRGCGGIRYWLAAARLARLIILPRGEFHIGSPLRGSPRHVLHCPGGAGECQFIIIKPTEKQFSRTPQ